MANNITILSMYRTILRLHARKLPAEMRALGDAYVKSEFRAIRQAKKPEFIQTFIESWKSYINTLEKQMDQFGADLSESAIQKMNEEQRLQLRKMRAATSTTQNSSSTSQSGAPTL